MDKGALDNQMKCSKIWNIVISSIFVVLAITVIIGFGTYKYKHTFTIDKWNTNPKDRYKIVSDMIEKYDIIGMTEPVIAELLGKEDSEQSSFKISREVFHPDSTLVYYLSVDLMDNNWLIISIENGIAVSYCIDVT